MDQELQSLSQSNDGSMHDLPMIIQEGLHNASDFDPFTPSPLSVQFPALESSMVNLAGDLSLQKLSLYMRRRTRDLEQIAEEDSLQPELSDFTEITPSDFRKKSSFVDSIKHNNLASSNEDDFEPNSIYQTAAKRDRASRGRIARRRTIELTQNSEVPQAILNSKLNFSEETYEVKTDSVTTKHTQDFIHIDGKLVLPNTFFVESSPLDTQHWQERPDKKHFASCGQQTPFAITESKVRKISQFDVNSLFKKKISEKCSQRGNHTFVEIPHQTERLRTSPNKLAITKISRSHLTNHSKDSRPADREDCKLLPLGNDSEYPKLSARIHRHIKTSYIKNEFSNSHRADIKPSHLSSSNTKCQLDQQTVFTSRILKSQFFAKHEAHPLQSERKPVITPQLKELQPTTTSFKRLPLQTPQLYKMITDKIGVKSEGNRLKSRSNLGKAIFNSNSVNMQLWDSSLSKRKANKFTKSLKGSSLINIQPFSEQDENAPHKENQNNKNRQPISSNSRTNNHADNQSNREWISKRFTSNRKLAAADSVPPKAPHSFKETCNGQMAPWKEHASRWSKFSTRQAECAIDPNKISGQLNSKSTLDIFKQANLKNMSSLNKKQVSLKTDPTNPKSRTARVFQQTHFHTSIPKKLKQSFGSESFRGSGDITGSTLDVYKRHSLDTGRPNNRLGTALELYAFLPDNQKDNGADYCSLFKRFKEISASIRGSKLGGFSNLSSRRPSRSNDASLE
jgi:hypothetical protein